MFTMNAFRDLQLSGIEGNVSAEKVPLKKGTVFKIPGKFKKIEPKDYIYVGKDKKISEGRVFDFESEST